MTALALLVVGAVVGTGARLGGRFEPTGWMLAAGVVVLALLLGSWAFVRRRRVRWQLDGWLRSRTARNPRPTAAVTLLRLKAAEVVSAEALQLPLWGGLGEEDRLRARRALVRVQGLLGQEAVRVPVLSGGRGPAERITLIPLGDELVPRADPDPPWPGRLPEPSPAVLLDDPVELLDAQGNPIRVTIRGLFSADPTRMIAHGRDERLPVQSLYDHVIHWQLMLQDLAGK